MKAYLLGAALVAVAAPAAAQSPFDGTFKGDVASAQLPTKPLMRSLKNGVYSCSCDIPLTVKADGQWQKMQGHPLADEMRVEIIGEDGLKIEARQAGKPTWIETDKVAPNGMTIAWTYTDFTAANGQPVKSSGIGKRVGALPAKGLHPINGGWVSTTEGANIDQASLTATFKAIPGGMAMTWGTGESYEAKFGGPAVPIKGEASGMTVALRQINATSFQETLARAGKPVVINTYVVAPDMSVMVTSENPVQKTVTKYKMIRQ